MSSRSWWNCRGNEIDTPSEAHCLLRNSTVQFQGCDSQHGESRVEPKSVFVLDAASILELKGTVTPINSYNTNTPTPPTSMAPHVRSRSPPLAFASSEAPTVMRFRVPDLQNKSKATTPLHESELDHEIVPLGDGDDRSSSLSEIEERPGNEEIGKIHTIPTGRSDGGDTEAETERLEESPQKLYEHGNTMQSSPNGPHMENHVATEYLNLRTGVAPESRMSAVAIHSQITRGGVDYDQIDQTSDISSLADFPEDISKAASPSSISRKKRKRSNQDLDESDQDTTAKALQRVSANLTNELLSGGSRQVLNQGGNPLADGMVYLDQAIEDRVTYDVEDAETDSRDPQSSRPKTATKGKRKGKKPKQDMIEPSVFQEAVPEAGETHSEIGIEINAGDSDGEDLDIAGVEGGEAEHAAKNEDELIKKKTAMDALSNIEKCFATLRDKLFDERLAHYNEELMQLSQTDVTHPEYLAMMECIDQRRDDKTQYEQTLLKYKLIALEKQSNAERAQYHSQYMQTVREVRDRILEQVSKELYQIQRERRVLEGDTHDHPFKFSTRRSQQITQQTAYNSEVSILSGVAKYVGFPAAPEINGARSSEVEEDFHRMGIGRQAQAINHNQPRARISAVTLQRSKPAEEQFLEQNPWANPQHPMHHQNANPAHRHMSQLSRPQSPFTTPVTQRRLTELSALNGSASTMVEAQSGHSSSVAATPVTVEHASSNPKHRIDMKNNLLGYTPSKQNAHLVKQTSPEANAVQTPSNYLLNSTTRTMQATLPDSNTTSQMKSQDVLSPPLKLQDIDPQNRVHAPADMAPSIFRIREYNTTALEDGSRSISTSLHPSLGDHSAITTMAVPPQLDAR